MGSLCISGNLGFYLFGSAYFLLRDETVQNQVPGHHGDVKVKRYGQGSLVPTFMHALMSIELSRGLRVSKGGGDVRS